MRAIKLNLDATYEVFELGPYPDLNRQINPDEAAEPFALSFLNGPTRLHPKHVTVGLAVDKDGITKRLPINALASSLRGVFTLHTQPVVGTVVVVGSTWRGKATSVPDWVIDLVREIKRSVDIAFKYHQDIEGN
jgi:hypothetical protein